MTAAPVTPPPDLVGAAHALACCLAIVDADDRPLSADYSPAKHRRALEQALDRFAAAVIFEARQERDLDAAERRLPRPANDREAVPAGRTRRGPCPWLDPDTVPPSPGAVKLRFEQRADGDRVVAFDEAGREWHVEGVAEFGWTMNRGELPYVDVRLVRPLVEHIPTSAAAPAPSPEPDEVPRLRARVAELEEHARKQHALDGERLRDLLAMVEGCEAWRGTPNNIRALVLRVLTRPFPGWFDADMQQGFLAAVVALRALTPEPPPRV